MEQLVGVELKLDGDRGSAINKHIIVNMQYIFSGKIVAMSHTFRVNVS